MNSSRTANTIRNIFWGYLGNILTLLLQFASRTVFIYSIGVTFLGVNGLFTSVLGMLSLTELGIGTAMNYSLYKPISENNVEKIQSLMHVYKKAYRTVAIAVLLLGLLLLPFLHIIIKDISKINNANLYYLIFLFNIVSSYFVSYKYGLINASQKGYIITNLNSVFSIITSLAQIIVLLVLKNYTAYLICQMCCQLIQKIYMNSYINNLYPFLKATNIKPLAKNELTKIILDVKGLIIHKIGEVSIHQTDNIIVSAFVDIVTVGLLSNYNMIINSVVVFITIIINGTTASLGNLIATEDKEKQLKIFDLYNFIGFWLYAFTGICFFVLFKPFISFWIGSDKLIDDISLGLIVINHYLQGQRMTLSNMKIAGGVFRQDQYISLFQGAINLIVSILMVRMIGLPGVFLGTVLSGLFSNIVRPIIVFKTLFDISAKRYFKSFFIYLASFLIGLVLAYVFGNMIRTGSDFYDFILRGCFCTAFCNFLFLFLFRKTSELIEVKQRIVCQMLGRKIK